MLAPGIEFDPDGRVYAQVGSAVTPAAINQGVGFSSLGQLCIDTDAPSGSFYKAGIRLSASGAIYGTSALSPDDIYIEGLRVSVLGQLVYDLP